MRSQGRGQRADYQLLRDNPELARQIKANDLGKYSAGAGVKRAKRSSVARSSSQSRAITSGATSAKEIRAGYEDTDEPWMARVMNRPKAGAKLAELSDEER
jgi:hypothetical protein